MGGDDARAFGPFVNGKSPYFASINHGKEIDRARPQGRRATATSSRGCSTKADVLVENFRPGTMEKLGYGWETLQQRFPRLIYAAASGFGHSGPFSKRPPTTWSCRAWAAS